MITLRVLTLGLTATLCLALASTAARSQGFTGEVRVNSDAAGAMQGSPVLRIGPDGRLYVLWVEIVNGRGAMKLAISSDGGATFSPARTAVEGHTALAGMQRGPQLAIDRQGGLHMVWQERVAASTASAMYSRSTDGGVTFSTPIFAAADNGTYDQDFPSIAVDSSDNVVMAWVDNRDVKLGTLSNTQLYFTRSTDRGATFGAPVRASRMPGGNGGSCECCNTSIAAAADGAVFIAFRGNIDNYRDVHIARTTDGGASFDVFRAASQSWQIAACPMTGSSIAVDRNGTAHVVWRDSRQASSGRDIVYYATLARDGASSSSDLQVSDSPKKANFPSIGVTGAGAVVIAWQDTRADASDIQTSYSLDGGNTFAASAPIGGAPIASRQELVSIAIAADGTRYAVWQDARRDAGDIVLARDASPLALAAPAAVTAAYPVDGATVTSLPALLWSAPSNLGDARQVSYSVRIVDAAGDTTSFDAQSGRSLAVSLPPGRYGWWVVARSSVGETLSGPFTFTLQSTSGVEELAAALDARIAPTPASSADGAILRFSLERTASVGVALHDIGGRIVATSRAGSLDAGAHSLVVGRGLPAGRYLARLDVDGHVVTLPLVIR
jgi:hypothetical protein